MGDGARLWWRRAGTFVVAHRMPVGLGACAVSLIVAAVYLVVVPVEADGASGVVGAVLRYGHAGCWALLAAVGALFAFDVAGRARRGLARSALAVYLVFIATFAATRSGLL
ncbi:hypothetical protein [Saccharothrix longispora]|uniref:hypothetical protein n=1 Tax=Saccharothrix longispora TaxID=33920 RepID=UPI0028FD289C|nr:hypothetical protein [Saccharothrix longispora]MDU0294391.1 hypothetical protein [Saccharothrix longispora]